MSTAGNVSSIQREPELLGQTVVVIGGSAGIGFAPIRVNLIAAGFGDTSLSASLLGDELENRRNQLRATLPIGRVVSPADVAAFAVHIMTNASLTGATYDIDGGQQVVAA